MAAPSPSTRATGKTPLQAVPRDGAARPPLPGPAAPPSEPRLGAPGPSAPTCIGPARPTTPSYEAAQVHLQALQAQQQKRLASIASIDGQIRSIDGQIRRIEAGIQQLAEDTEKGKAKLAAEIKAECDQMAHEHNQAQNLVALGSAGEAIVLQVIHMGLNDCLLPVNALLIRAAERGHDHPCLVRAMHCTNDAMQLVPTSALPALPGDSELLLDQGVSADAQVVHSAAATSAGSASQSAPCCALQPPTPQTAKPEMGALSQHRAAAITPQSCGAPVAHSMPAQEAKGWALTESPLPPQGLSPHEHGVAQCAGEASTPAQTETQQDQQPPLHPAPPPSPLAPELLAQSQMAPLQGRPALSRRASAGPRLLGAPGSASAGPPRRRASFCGCLDDLTRASAAGARPAALRSSPLNPGNPGTPGSGKRRLRSSGLSETEPPVAGAFARSSPSAQASIQDGKTALSAVAAVWSTTTAPRQSLDNALGPAHRLSDSKRGRFPREKSLEPRAAPQASDEPLTLPPGGAPHRPAALLANHSSASQGAEGVRVAAATGEEAGRAPELVEEEITRSLDNLLSPPTAMTDRMGRGHKDFDGDR